MDIAGNGSYKVSETNLKCKELEGLEEVKTHFLIVQNSMYAKWGLNTFGAAMNVMKMSIDCQL